MVLALVLMLLRLILAVLAQVLRTDGTGTGTGSSGTDHSTGPCKSQYMRCGWDLTVCVYKGRQWKSTVW